MDEEVVEGAGERVYIPILPRSAVAPEKTPMTGVDLKLIPRIWTGEIEKSLRYHAVTEQLLDRNRTIRVPRKTPLTTRIKNRLADFLRHQATRLDGYDPEAYDEDY